MAVYVDEIVEYGHGPTCLRKGSSHMWADTLEELHSMADAIGMKRAWFQAGGTIDHYDVTPARRAKALELGAIFKPARQAARERIAARSLAYAKYLESVQERITRIIYGDGVSYSTEQLWERLRDVPNRKLLEQAVQALEARDLIWNQGDDLWDRDDPDHKDIWQLTRDGLNYASLD